MKLRIDWIGQAYTILLIVLLHQGSAFAQTTPTVRYYATVLQRSPSTGNWYNTKAEVDSAQAVCNAWADSENNYYGPTFFNPRYVRADFLDS